ncbi:MAG: tRNA lysidine(34) synthetase TilS [Thermosipho sp. (in: Bacteria)]|nr:tRNA lysidine(34) synthetase TilS [Thermosipho sp. (in: thermotogales)]
MLTLESFIRFLKEYKLIEENDKILVAVSGGIDSSVLLYLLNKVRRELKINIICATLDHGIRENSMRDVKFVEDLAETLEIECVVGKVDVPSYAIKNKLSVEEAARILRYQFLEGVLEEKKCNKIAVAHNLNDLVENVLFRLSRGTGPFGLPGMKPKSKNVIRPLLFFTREEIIDFARKNNIKYMEDETNYDIKYTRNYIRHTVVPMLKKINPRFELSVLRFVENIWELDEFISNQLKNIKLRSLRGRLYFKVPEAPYLMVELVRRLSVDLFGRAPDKEKLDRLKNVMNAKTTFKISFWGNLGLEVSYGKALLGKFLEKEAYEFVVGNMSTFDFDPFLVKIGNDGIIINKRKIKGELILRNWRDGDRTSNGKKIKDIFVSKKIPSFIRRIIPVFADENGIIYIPKVYLNKEYLGEENNENIIGIKVELKGGFSI